MNNEPSRPEQAVPANEGPEWEIEAMIEEVWHQLQGRVNRTDILQVLLEILPKYEDARVTLYVPIFVRREAVAVLRTRLDDETPPVNPVRVNGAYSTEASPNDRTYEHNRDRHNKPLEKSYGYAYRKSYSRPCWRSPDHRHIRWVLVE
jgi:hypothetical protein